LLSGLAVVRINGKLLTEKKNFFDFKQLLCIFCFISEKNRKNLKYTYICVVLNQISL
jgi:hypothetical protein